MNSSSPVSFHMDGSEEIDFDEEIFGSEGTLLLPNKILSSRATPEVRIESSLLPVNEESYREISDGFLPVDEKTKELAAALFDTLLPPALPDESELKAAFQMGRKREYEETGLSPESKKARKEPELLDSVETSNNVEVFTDQQVNDAVLTPNTTVARRHNRSPFPTNSSKTKHVCLICFKQFKRAHNLKIHGRLHSGVKPYPCPFPDCKKEFRWKSSIVSHLNWHRTKKGDVLPGEPSDIAVFSPKVTESSANESGTVKVESSKIIKDHNITEAERTEEKQSMDGCSKQRNGAKTEVSRSTIWSLMDRCPTSHHGDEFAQEPRPRTYLSQPVESELYFPQDCSEQSEVNIQQLMDEMTHLATEDATAESKTQNDLANTPSTTAESSREKSPPVSEMEDIEGLPYMKDVEVSTQDVRDTDGDKDLLCMSGMLLPSLSSCKTDGAADGFTSLLDSDTKGM